MINFLLYVAVGLFVSRIVRLRKLLALQKRFPYDRYRQLPDGYDNFINLVFSALWIVTVPSYLVYKIAKGFFQRAKIIERTDAIVKRIDRWIP